MADKKWDMVEIKVLLATRDEMVRRSLVQIFNLQTADEQRNEETSHTNGVGFNGVDAPLLSSFAKQVIAGSKLSPKQIAIARKRIMKYSRQLTKIANKEIG